MSDEQRDAIETRPLSTEAHRPRLSDGRAWPRRRTPAATATADAEPPHEEVVRGQGAERPGGLDQAGTWSGGSSSENLEPYVGRIVVPVEKITEVRDGKRRIKKVKKFPGYLFCEVEFNEHVLYLFRETAGSATLWAGPAPTKPAAADERPGSAADAGRPGRSCRDGGEEEEEGRGEAHGGKGRIKLDYESGTRSRSWRGCSRTWKGQSRTSPTGTASPRR